MFIISLTKGRHRVTPVMNNAKKFKYRYPGISDVLVLVAATALATAATRYRWASYFDAFKPGGIAYRETFVNFMYRVRTLLFSASFYTAVWSLTCLMLGLRRPRQACRHVLQQPGMVACLVAVVVLCFRVVGVAIAFILQMAYLDEASLNDMLITMEEIRQIPSEIGCAVTAAWVTQWASGRWRPEAYWIDRMGRGLGFLWISTIPFSYFSWDT